MEEWAHQMKGLKPAGPSEKQAPFSAHSMVLSRTTKEPSHPSTRNEGWECVEGARPSSMPAAEGHGIRSTGAG